MFNLGEMTVSNWHECGEALADGASAAQSMEQAAGRIVTYLYHHLCTPGAEESRTPACVLVRLYKTHSYRSLPVDLMDFVDATLGELTASPDLKCLTLMATAGDEPAWNDRTRSVGHQAIALLSEEAVARIPMVARLVSQFGLDTKAVLKPDADLMLELEQKKYPVFYVEDANGSPYIPAQGFVSRYGVRSVVGFGGMLPSGDLYAVILFSRVPVARAAAEEFASLALPVKIALLPFTFQNVFASANYAPGV